MTISAKVICHSRADSAPDLITLECRYPRFIHAEAKTHRVMNIDDAEVEFMQEISFMDDENLSRNASSSRAIPIERMIRDVMEDPAMPVSWGSNNPGMQAGQEIDTLIEAWVGSDQLKLSPQEAWREARDAAVEIASGFAKAGYHKQIVNRLLEPFGHITVVVTATEWGNFFDLRCHPDADPTMRALAEAMLDAIDGSTPSASGYHLPYLTQDDAEVIWSRNDGQNDFNTMAMISAARCARVSYLNHDGSAPNIDKDLKLAEMLRASKHMSPFEHQARLDDRCADGSAAHPHLAGNFAPGWQQHRKMIEVAS